MKKQPKKKGTTKGKRKGIVNSMEKIEIVGITGGALVSLQGHTSSRLKAGDLLRVRSVNRGEYQFERLQKRSLAQTFLLPPDDLVPN